MQDLALALDSFVEQYISALDIVTTIHLLPYIYYHAPTIIHLLTYTYYHTFIIIPLLSYPYYHNFFSAVSVTIIIIINMAVK